MESEPVKKSARKLGSLGSSLRCSTFSVVLEMDSRRLIGCRTGELARLKFGIQLAQ